MSGVRRSSSAAGSGNSAPPAADLKTQSRGGERNDSKSRGSREGSAARGSGSSLETKDRNESKSRLASPIFPPFLLFFRDGLEREIRKDQASLAAKCPTEPGCRGSVVVEKLRCQNYRRAYLPLCGEISLVEPYFFNLVYY